MSVLLFVFGAIMLVCVAANLIVFARSGGALFPLFVALFCSAVAAWDFYHAFALL